MSNPTLYLHVGTHKTGSSSLQRELEMSSPQLREEGIVYITLDKLKSLRLKETLDHDLIGDLRDKLNKIKKKTEIRDPTFVISCESLSGNKYKGYKNSGILAKSVRKLTAAFEVYIIVYLRRQDSFIESLYTHKIREGESYSFETFLECTPSTDYDWYELLQNYAEYFGKEKIIVRRYDKAHLPRIDSLVKSFASIIESDTLAQDTNSTVTINTGYKRDTLEIARISNPYLTAEERKDLYLILQSVGTKLPFEEYTYFEPDQRKEFMANFTRSNSKVAKEYLNDSSGPLFPTTKSNNNLKVYRGLTLESLVVFFAKTLVSQPSDPVFITVVKKIERKIFLFLEKTPALKKFLKKIYHRFF